MSARQWSVRVLGCCLAVVDVAGAIWLFPSVWKSPLLLGELIGFTLIVLFAVAVGAMFFVRARGSYWIAASVISTYRLVYVAASVTGHYHWLQSGHLRYGGGLSVTDRVIWNPRCMWWEPFRDVSGKDTTRGNSLGYLYSPLLCLDRQWLHPTEILFDNDGLGKFDSQIPLGVSGVTSHDARK